MEMSGGRDRVTGLQSRTRYGRPDWTKEFDNMCRAHTGTEVAVFFCGPAVLSKMLYKECRRITMTDPNGTRFRYNKENF